MKPSARALIATALMSLVLSAVAGGGGTVPGGPWADGYSASDDGDAPSNQGLEQSRERVRQAESAREHRLNEDKRQLRNSVENSLERRRQENREESQHLRDRATRPPYHGGY